MSNVAEKPQKEIKEPEQQPASLSEGEVLNQQEAGTALVETNPVAATLAVIANAVRDPAVDVDKLERVFALQERLIERQERSAFDDAMARISAKLTNVRLVKNKSVAYDIDKNDKKKGQKEAFKYIPLEDIHKVVQPLLDDEDITPSYDTAEAPNGWNYVIGRLNYKGTVRRECKIPLPLDTSGGKSNVQGMGSTFSYGQRYALKGLLNLNIIGEDNDGQVEPVFISLEQAVEIDQLIPQVCKDPAVFKPKFLAYMRVSSVQDIRASEFKKAMTMLNSKGKK